jgi:uncharacterized protein YqfA (UPF0365 family)
MSAKTKGKKVDDDLEITDMDDNEETNKSAQEKRRTKFKATEDARAVQVKEFMAKLAEKEVEQQKPLEYKNLVAIKVSPQNILQNMGDYTEKGYTFITSVAYGLTILVIMRKPVKEK